MEPPVSILCCSGRSHYHHIPGCVPFGPAKDAFTFQGPGPVVAHPPCRTWSRRLRHQAKPDDLAREQELARHCVRMVIKHGGVLEQPAGSLLWHECELPFPGDNSDAFLFTLALQQSWFGLPILKPTWLLISGVPFHLLPPQPFSLVSPRPNQFSELSKAQRSRTTRALALWLVTVARQSWWSLPSRARTPARAGARST